jgi:hypothetical protein
LARGSMKNAANCASTCELRTHEHRHFERTLREEVNLTREIIMIRVMEGEKRKDQVGMKMNPTEEVQETQM